jgi:hypothetical protein
VKVTSQPIPLGDPTVTRGLPRYPNGDAIPLADVEEIHAVAFVGNNAEPFWTHDYEPADIMTEDPSTEGWTLDDVGFTFNHELQHGAFDYYPPLGRVTIEYVLRLTSGAVKTVVREVDYELGRAVFGGHVVP